MVDDDEGTRSRSKELLDRWGYQTDSANDGIEGIQKIKSFKPDIVLAKNLVAPKELDFLERAQTEDPTVGLFVTEADSYTSSVQPVRLTAVNYLPRYFSPMVLRAKLEAYLNGSRRPLRAFSDYSSIKVLIVEDEENERAGLAALLKRWGYQTDTAGDGFEGLQKIESFKPDLVITDIMMPRMDGVEFLEKVHANHPSIGFIMLTARGTIADAVHTVRGGAHTYLTKPISGVGLKMELQAYFDGRQPPLRVFLCHSSTDKLAVRKLYRRSKRHNYCVSVA